MGEWRAPGMCLRRYRGIACHMPELTHVLSRFHPFLLGTSSSCCASAADSTCCCSVSSGKLCSEAETSTSTARSCSSRPRDASSLSMSVLIDVEVVQHFISREQHVVRAGRGHGACTTCCPIFNAQSVGHTPLLRLQKTGLCPSDTVYSLQAHSSSASSSSATSRGWTTLSRHLEFRLSLSPSP